MAVCLLGCRSSSKGESKAEPAGSARAEAGAGARSRERPPPPRKGMVWIPAGALVAGTPPDSLPRVADEEMLGEQVIMTPFFIDVYPYPNEEGAIPETSVSRQEAATLCRDLDKRLCTELEWERACKGPENHIYEYGDRYRPEICGTGSKPQLLPTGLRFGCTSGFGARDMHGGVWEWTGSDWGRGDTRGLATIRGGNAVAGEIVGRCANARAADSSRKDGTLGFRCCAGEENRARVTLHVTRGKKLEWKEPIDRELARALEKALPEDAKQELPSTEAFKIDRMWRWRPVGNEELVLAGGCAGIGKEPSCGVVVARVVLEEPKPLAWASSGHWAPTLHMDTDPRDVWVFAGDDLGSFRRLIAYAWGRVTVGAKERRPARPPKRKRRKGRRR